ncbi:hypothetical protein [Candidatus Manganitrophus noduliformans]|nr:hypothetical protein [Candidatus Manganitrophus noduliformans]
MPEPRITGRWFGEDQDRATFATRLQPKEFNQLVWSGNGFTGATMNS